MAKFTEHISLTKFDDLLGGDKKESKEAEVNISDLHPFKNHPFHVNDDDEMAQLIKSIELSGVLVPITVRKDLAGGYEILSGHRRTHAAKMAGLTKIPALIKSLDDDAAVILMVESNRQREVILPSEKAFAYKMLMEALKHQGKRQSGETAAEIGKDHGDSKSNVKRYIRLTNLDPELLTMVDNKQLGLVQGVDISYLLPAEQKILIGLMHENPGVVMKKEQSERLKQESQAGNLNETFMKQILIGVPKTDKRKFVMKTDKINHYFPPHYTSEEIENVIMDLLNRWKDEQES